MKPLLHAPAAAVLLGLCDADNFTDRFDHLDAARWTVSDGWSNAGAFLNDWRRSQVRTSKSGLAITLTQTPASKTGYSSGEIQSRQSYQYGYYEAKLQAAVGSGVVTGFFTYTGPSRGKEWNEVDIEILGRDPHAVQFTYHTGSQQRATTIKLPFDASAESHTYAFDWQPGFINWYIDGRLAHSETRATLPLPTLPQQIMFDVWNSNSLRAWMGSFVWQGAPPTAKVLCIAHAQHFAGTSLCQ